eukprot:Sdes_comp16370_c0_seq2m5724
MLNPPVLKIDFASYNPDLSKTSFLFLDSYFRETSKEYQIFLQIAKKFKTKSPFFASADPLLIQTIANDSSLPALVVIKKDKIASFAASSFSDFQLERFCLVQRFQNVEKLDSLSSADLLDSKLPLVICVLNSLREQDGFLLEFGEFAELYRSNHSDLLFAWIDSHEWGHFVYKNWGISESDNPKIVFWKPTNDSYLLFSEYDSLTFHSDIHSPEMFLRLQNFINDIQSGQLELVSSSSVFEAFRQTFRWVWIILSMAYENHFYALMFACSIPFLCCAVFYIFSETVENDFTPSSQNTQKVLKVD